MQNIYWLVYRYFTELAQNNPAVVVAASNEELITESETKIEADQEVRPLDAITLNRLYKEVRCH